MGTSKLERAERLLGRQRAGEAFEVTMTFSTRGISAAARLLDAHPEDVLRMLLYESSRFNVKDEPDEPSTPDAGVRA